jgi:hypothetical protein
MGVGMDTIEWSPVSSLGASFCTHRLSVSSNGKLEFKPTLGMKLFYLVFCFLTYFTPLFFIGGFIAGEVPVYALLMVFGVTFLFSYVCRLLHKMTFAPNVFDRMHNRYYAIESSILGAEKEIEETISAIKALQILSKRIVSSKNSYTAYELNLVMDSGTRRTVLSHASYDDIKRDAQTIGMHLGLSVLEKE